MNKIDELETKIKELSDEIEKLKADEESKAWKPKRGDSYWLISHTGYAVQARWIDDSIENDIYEIGNVFRTNEEAEFRIEQLKVEAELRRFSRPFVVGERNYSFYFDHRINCICTTDYSYTQEGNIHFASEEIAQKAIDTVGEERIKKYYFGVED